jgi:hypothetical protein
LKKRHIDHLLRAAGELTGERQFIIIGSQALHGKHPDVAATIARSAEIDLVSKSTANRAQWLNAIGHDSPFHESFGYYADPADETTAKLPKGWKSRLVALPEGDTNGVRGLCLDPHDLAISKYVARREKDLLFTRELAKRGYTARRRLLELVKDTPVSDEVRTRIREDIGRDFPSRAYHSKS